MEERGSNKTALCGLIGALMIIVMLLGSIVPIASLLCPAIAGLFLIPAIRECGMRSGVSLYGAVAILSLILLPDKEVSLLFTILLGPFLLLQPLLNRISHRPLRMLAKLLVGNLLLVLCYTLLLLVLAPAGLTAELGAYSRGMLSLLLILFNVMFIVYDICIAKITLLYECKLRNRLFHPKRNKK